MQDFPLVSLVTPTYNQAKYLIEAIESVLSQDYPNIEYIVLDDGSEDETPDVLQRYQSKIRWAKHKNIGQARTLNKGWTLCRGELLGYLSSDDRLLPSGISHLVHAMRSNPSDVVAFGDFELIDSHGKVIRSVQTGDFDYRRLIEDLDCQPGPGALFRRRVIEEVGGWSESLKQIPDFEFWIRASQLGHFTHVKKPLAQFRIHEGSASFRPVSYSRSVEIVDTMKLYWSNRTEGDMPKSMARAYVLAARSHGQSGRYMDSVSAFLRAIEMYPKVVLSMVAWRLWLFGFFRRIFYRVRLWR